jgi:hypothetical protein
MSGYTKGYNETHSHKTKGTLKGASIQSDSQAASVKQVHSTQASLSEPDDSMSSDVESFDEEDMYPANYNDESVSDRPDSNSDVESQSPLRGPVRALLYIMFTYPEI